MNTKMILSLAFAASLAMVTSSFAAPRTWSKATGNYDDSMSQRPMASVRRAYRSVAPRVVREAPASEAVATAPSTTRRYSYEPAPRTATRESAPVQNGVRSTRRYSYEPSVRTYAPRTRSFQASPNSLPKSDPRRYNF